MKPILRHGLMAPDPRACAQFGLDLALDRGQPIVNLVRQPEFHRYPEAGDYAASIIVASNRDTGRTLALQLVPFAAEQKLLMSRDVTELEAVSRMRRDFIGSDSICAKRRSCTPAATSSPAHSAT
jgi:two-component system, OmpR family, phosphate regulon sensor histidine kinase PhoR